MRPRVVRGDVRGWWWQRAPAGMKAAAAIALLFGLVIAVPDARAWMIDQLRAVGEQLGLLADDDAAPAPDDPTADAVVPGAAASVTFTVTRDTLDIVLEVANALVVRRADVMRATAESREGTEFTVLPSALRIGGAVQEQPIVITVPSRVTAVRVRVANGVTSLHVLGPDQALLIGY
jgi:hypothetical protein